MCKHGFTYGTAGMASSYGDDAGMGVIHTGSRRLSAQKFHSADSNSAGTRAPLSAGQASAVLENGNRL
jgi:hypothetical protein